jgi:peptidyl-prolyl cis-trans isomerase-like protein 2
MRCVVNPTIHCHWTRLTEMQEELMFEDIANPPKGKGKEKDVGKRRAYVRVVTSLGGGSLNLELFCEKVILTLYLDKFCTLTFGLC